MELGLVPGLIGETRMILPTRCSALAAGLFVALLAVPSPAGATDRCAELAKPQEFTKATAMLALFCQYNDEHGGTLIPLKHTSSWQIAEAQEVLSPLVVATYREAGVRRGVIAIQRQEVSGGRIEESHATAATISVYVFKHTGAEWVFEKGEKEALTAGAHGSAPAGRLARLGDDEFGLWFEGGDVHQGYTNDYAIALALSEPAIVELGTFDTGQSNSGTCGDDAKEKKRCWEYEARAEFAKLEGQSYYLLRLQYRGTREPASGGKIVPHNRTVDYKVMGGKYKKVVDQRYVGVKSLPGADVFRCADTEEDAQPIPTLPRTSLKFK